MSPRAPSLKPEERRQAIVCATLPLIREQGLGVSTAEIARAAGVAEGTLFRVFTNKSELLHTVCEHVMDPADSLQELAAIDRALPLRDRLVAIVRITHARIAEISLIISALHAGGEAHPEPARSRERHLEHTRVIADAVAGVLAPDAERFTLGLDQTAALLRSLAFATAHPYLTDGAATDPEIVVELFLHGVLTGDR
jgi:AcrR family transcriptional regulator